jgi:hypothetical protein
MLTGRRRKRRRG